MGLNNTPAANRIHIGFFGQRNAGKSSLVNAVIGQDLAVVSEIKGTTTDPVYKTMELLPLGPVMIIDTPGLDDKGVLGEKRIRKTHQVLNKTDVAVLVVDAALGLTQTDWDLLNLFKAKAIPFIVAFNKSDLLISTPDPGPGEIYLSALTTARIDQFKETLARLAVTDETKLRLVGDLINPSDFVILVTPIDKAAPKGRLILPQQQTIRDILEADAVAIMVKEFELRETLENLGRRPSLVITDSQVFAKVSADTPENIPLTSFSILFARYKGLLAAAVSGTKALEVITDSDTILIAEGCTHHRQCDDIGTVKLPRWIRNYTNKNLNFAFTAGGDFPNNLSPYRLIVHCGGCMLNRREIIYRQKCAQDQGVPITNYGILIAQIQGILKRSLTIFPYLLAELEDQA